ncbi:helix-turn-helix domain-containing protein [Planomonospora corallina]|uniref:Helix-turn-helix domain-containing protein n=1 Tax=Planomonospora corallina TaxID=1806052 RepID=A0ABV8I7Z6_9ACTN
MKRNGDPFTIRNLGNGGMRAILEALAQAETDECVIVKGRDRQWPVNTGAGWVSASRMMWIIRYGDPGELHVLHSCNGGSGNNGCVNVRHLYLGDNSRNVLDRGDAGVQVGEDHHSSVLTTAAVKDIRKRAAAGESHSSLAREYGVSRTTVSDVVNARTWRRLLNA